jgi:hypothetical protein
VKAAQEGGPAPLLAGDDDLAEFLRGFHSVALAAYVLTAAETNQWPPDSETTRLKAYDLYEAELAKRNQEQLREEPA